jgi:hypothetical protein
MPILYVHGVATRDSIGFDAMVPYLRRIVAPAISKDPGGVEIIEVFWGGSAATFAWKGASRPRTRLLGQGVADGVARPSDALMAALLERHLLQRIPEPATAAAAPSGLASGVRAPQRAQASVRLSSLPDDELSDVLAAAVFATVPDPQQAANLTVDIDMLVRRPALRVELQRQQTADDEAAFIASKIEDAARAARLLAGMGTGPFAGLRDRLGEAVSRGGSLPAYTLSVLAAELRPGINELASVFLGDVFVYLAERGDAAAPGPIMNRLLSALNSAQAKQRARGGEPIVAISHSMGGQLVYDAVTHFLPGAHGRQSIRVDFWCATASQVAFFEELKLFKLKDPKLKTPDKVPFPENLGVWWNVWDPNDFLSFTAADIFDGVDDEPYNSGLSVVAAHSGYLQRASFYRRLAQKLESASNNGWRTV